MPASVDEKDVPAPEAAQAAETPRIGAKIRRLRRSRGLTQAGLAESLGVSASYLNLIEHNRRRITVGLLLRLSEIFGMDLQELAADAEGRLVADLMGALSDDLFQEVDLTNTDVRELVTASPNGGRAMLKLFDAYQKANRDLRRLADQLDDEEEDGLDLGPRTPAERVSDFLQDRNNYFPDLEDEAARLAADVKGDRPIHTEGMAGIGFATLVDHVRTVMGGRVAMLPPEAGPKGAVEVRTHYDSTTRTLELSDRLPTAAAKFQIAREIGLHSVAPVIGMLLREGGLTDVPAMDLGRTVLANYFAAALLMPYDAFLKSAEAVRYDIELLETQYRTSFEQVCHRLTTLNRPGEAGIPFHMMRVDGAGTISKRVSLSGLHIPRHGRAQADWIGCKAFMTPGMVRTQLTQLPDGQRFFSIARTIERGSVGYHAPKTTYAIELGCDATHAKRLVYADGIDLERPDVVRRISVL